MYKLRVSAATGMHAFNAKYIKVNSDKVIACKEHPYSAAFLDNVGVITALLCASLNPAEMVSPEFVIDEDFMNGYQDFNIYPYAEKHGLKPVFGYIVSPKSDAGGRLACGIHAHNHIGFYKNDVLYVPVEHSVVSSMLYNGKPVPRFFIPDAAVSPSTLEVLRTVSQMFFPESMPSGEHADLSVPLDADRDQEPTAPPPLASVAAHPHRVCRASHELCSNYLHLQKAACVVDHSLALAMNSSMSFIDIPKRDGFVTEDFQCVFMMTMGPSFDYQNHPLVLAKGVLPLPRISLDYTAVGSKGVAKHYCSEACFRVEARWCRGNVVRSVQACIPHWKKLHEMEVIPLSWPRC